MARDDYSVTVAKINEYLYAKLKGKNKIRACQAKLLDRMDEYVRIMSVLFRRKLWQLN